MSTSASSLKKANSDVCDHPVDLRTLMYDTLVTEAYCTSHGVTELFSHGDVFPSLYRIEDIPYVRPVPEAEDLFNKLSIVTLSACDTENVSEEREEYKTLLDLTSNPSYSSNEDVPMANCPNEMSLMLVEAATTPVSRESIVKRSPCRRRREEVCCAALLYKENNSDSPDKN
jgi:hypothetical protein